MTYRNCCGTKTAPLKFNIPETSQSLCSGSASVSSLHLGDNWGNSANVQQIMPYGDTFEETCDAHVHDYSILTKMSINHLDERV